MRKLIKGMVAGCLVVIGMVLAGCLPEQLEDGYQPGDGIGMAADAFTKAETLRDAYCDKGDATARVVLLTVVKAYMPEYPPDGICTDDLFLKALTKALPAPDPM